MQAIDSRKATMIMAGLVCAGACLVAIGATSTDPKVTTLLPLIGAALVAAGTMVLLQGQTLTGRRSIVLGIAFLATGIIVAVIGSTSTVVLVAAALPPIGGAFVTVGTLCLVSGAAGLAAPVKSLAG